MPIFPKYKKIVRALYTVEKKTCVAFQFKA